VTQFTSIGNFFVQDRSGRYYSATFLADVNGHPIVDPVIVGTPSMSPHTPQQLALYADQQGTVMANPGNYLVVPSADFMNKMYDLGRIYGQALDIDPSGAAGLLVDTFTPKFGFGDAQYNDHRNDAWHDTLFGTPDRFIPAFTDAGNFGAGVFGQAANAFSNGAFTSTQLLQIFGWANTIYSRINMSAPFGNSPWGYESISEGFNFTTVKPSGTSFDPNDLTPAFHHCFVRGTPVLLTDGNQKPIEQIEVGDIVFAFDGHGQLQPRRVLRLFENTTTELIELSPAPDHQREAETVGFTTLIVTPAHAFLTADGQFREIGKTIRQSNLQGAPAQIVLSSGAVIGVQAKHIAWSIETADRYERSDLLSYASVGNAALAPRIEQGWKTYNFEVEDLHTYVAGGVRVHNASDPAFAFDAAAFQQQFGHSFTGSVEDTTLLAGAIATGQIQPTFGNVDTTGNDRFTGPFFTGSGDKVVISTDSTTWFASMVKNGEIGRIIQNNDDGSRVDSQYDSDGRLRTQEDVFTNGTKAIQYIDTKNTHPYTELDIDEDATGKVTAATPKIDGQPSGNVDFSTVGQVLGSALGRALAPNNQFVQLAAGTVVGAVGQKLAQAFVASLTTDAASVSLNSVFSDFNVSIAGAGASSVASFLVAELGTALHLDGFGAQLFNAGAGGFAGSVASQIATKMAAGASFDAAIGTVNFANAAASAAYGISSLLGSYLGHELVPAQTHEGAVGGQLLGAVGSAIGISAAIANLLGSALNFLLPGVGSLIGTVLGTIIGDHFGSVPHPAAVDTIDPAGDHYGYNHSQVSASDGGDYAIPDPMATSVDAIVNAYFSAVHGVVLDHFKQTMVGYVTDPDFRYISGWAPTHHYYSFIHADDAVRAAALDILQHSEVIGGDLLLKRAHQNSASNVAGPEPEWAGLTTPSSQSGAEQLVTMSADLSVAQDYENYLNNREAINALIAANPDSAFAAGWIATFARVNDLGLNHMGASDFLGGLVGYLDSVAKAGLGAEAANATVWRDAGNSVIVEIKIANSVEVPGALSVFADHMTVTSDASGQTLQFTVNSGLGASGTLLLGPGSGTGGHDIMVGGAGNDVFAGGAGFDFIDGGAGNDTLYGEDGNDILRGGRGADYLFGGAGDDTYVFNRGNGADVVLDDVTFTTDTSHWHDWYEDQDGTNILHHDWVPETTTNHPNAGTDSLVFGPGIARSDIVVQRSGNDLIVGVKDPAHPGAVNDQITLQRWFDADGFDRIEKFVFADGTTLN
jgi:hypothetical protein